MSPSSDRPLRLRWRSALLAPKSGVSWSARLCAAVLAEYVNDASGMADPCPSASTLAAGMGTCKRTAQRGRLELEEAAWLAIERPAGRPLRARLLLPTSARQAPTPAPESRTPERQSRTPARQSPVPEDQKNQKTLAAPNDGAAEGRKRSRRGRRRDPLFEALVSVCEIDAAELTKSGRGAVNAALNQLREVGAEAADVRRRAARYRARFPSAALTAPALAKHWAELGPPGRAESSNTTAEDAVDRMRRVLAEKGLPG